MPVQGGDFVVDDSWFAVAPIVFSFCVWSLFCGVALSALFSFEIILQRTRELVDFIRSYFRVDICILYILLAVHWLGLWSVIVAFPAHTYELFLDLALVLFT